MNFEERRRDAIEEIKATLRLLEIEEGADIKLMLRGAPFGPGMDGSGMPTSVPQFFSGQFMGLSCGVVAIKLSTPDGSIRIAFPAHEIYLAAPSVIKTPDSTLVRP
jgi:hypothetical protein